MLLHLIDILTVINLMIPHILVSIPLMCLSILSTIQMLLKIISIACDPRIYIELYMFYIKYMRSIIMNKYLLLVSLSACFGIITTIIFLYIKWMIYINFIIYVAHTMYKLYGIYSRWLSW